MEFKLRFCQDLIHELASRYSYPNESTLTDVIGPAVQQRGWYTRDEFLEVAYWKSPRNQKHYAKNDDAFVTAITGASLSSPHERLRIEVLGLMDGVSWPTASVLIHFGHRDLYPILDFRALWSLSVSVTGFSMDVMERSSSRDRILVASIAEKANALG